jgi:hypothetical protein
MKTIKSQMKELCEQKIVNMGEFRLLKRLEAIRKYFGIPATKIVQDGDGAWSGKK